MMGSNLSDEMEKMKKDAENVSNYVSKWTPSGVQGNGGQNVLDPVVVPKMPSDTDTSSEIIYRAMFSHSLSTLGLQGSQ